MTVKGREVQFERRLALSRAVHLGKLCSPFTIVRDVEEPRFLQQPVRMKSVTGLV